MNSKQQKAIVQEYYATIAEQKSFCCSPSAGTSCTPVSAQTTKFSDADLGLSCGSPVDVADIQPGMTILDLGSGAGIDVFRAAELTGPTGKAIGLDMTDTMLQRATENQKKYGINNADFLKGDIESIPLPSNSVDRVISNCVINLVPDKRKAFDEIFRVLKPGGKCIISDIVSLAPIPAEMQNNPELWCACISGAMEKNDYLSLIKSVGFVNVTIVNETSYSSLNSDIQTSSVTVKASKPAPTAM